MTEWEVAVELERRGTKLSGQIYEDWAQGRAAFGGVVVGLAVRAAESALGWRRWVAMQANFLRPIGPGSVTLTVETLREGRHVRVARVLLKQDDVLGAAVTLTASAARETSIRHDVAKMPDVPGPHHTASLAFDPRRMPAFLRHYDTRWLGGGAPFQGSRDAHIMGWIQPRGVARVDTAAVLAMVDAWPAPVLCLLNRPAPASTVTWQVNLVRSVDVQPIGEQDWWFFDSRVGCSELGLADVSSRLWGPDGRLVASSTQLVAEFS